MTTQYLPAKQFLRIFAGYGLASLCSGMGVGIVFGTTDPHFSTEEGSTIFLSVWVTIFIGILAAVPSACAIIFAEAKRIGNPLYYVAVAVLIGVVLPAAGLQPSRALWVFSFGAVLGIPTGLIYWGIAGRHAGLPLSPDP